MLSGCQVVDCQVVDGQVVWLVSWYERLLLGRGQAGVAEWEGSGMLLSYRSLPPPLRIKFLE